MVQNSMGDRVYAMMWNIIDYDHVSTILVLYHCNGDFYLKLICKWSSTHGTSGKKPLKYYHKFPQQAWNTPAKIVVLFFSHLISEEHLLVCLYILYYGMLLCILLMLMFIYGNKKQVVLYHICMPGNL